MKKLLPLFTMISLAISGTALAQNTQGGFVENPTQQTDIDATSNTNANYPCDGQGYHQNSRHNGNMMHQNNHGYSNNHYNGPRHNGPKHGNKANRTNAPRMALVTVAQAKEMPDESRVSLKGYITSKIDKNDYIFKDDTGEIKVEIKSRAWAGQEFNANDLVQIFGEIDQDSNSMEIEVRRIHRVNPNAPTPNTGNNTNSN